MAKVTPISEHFQHFLAEMKESFSGDLYGRTQAAWKQFLEADSLERRDRYAVREAYQRRRCQRNIEMGDPPGLGRLSVCSHPTRCPSTGSRAILRTCTAPKPASCEDHWTVRDHHRLLSADRPFRSRLW
jgi:hypothetical protein